MARPASKPEKRAGKGWFELVQIVLISEALLQKTPPRLQQTDACVTKRKNHQKKLINR